MKILIVLIALILTMALQGLAKPLAKTGKKITAQEKAAAPARAVTMLSPAICGKGAFLFTAAGGSIGRESFEIKCEPEGYTASGHTEMKLASGSLDLNSSIEIDKSGLPKTSAVKGTVNNSPFDQTIAIKESTAVLTTNGKTREMPFANGTTLMGSNIFYMFQFILGRYDTAKGGVQQVPAFPGLSVRIERVGRDEVQPSSLTTGGQKTAFDRYTLTIGLSSFNVWVDQRGRLAVISIPAQAFDAVLEEYKDHLPGLKGAVASTTKEAEPDYSAPAGAAFTAEDVTVEAKGFKLAGTLLLPKSGKPPFPAVITITGSGQQTRDEALPIPGLEKYRPFRQVAETLASRGIAVLRVDDRGVGKSTGVDTLKTASSFDFADDVRAQVEYLRKRPEIDPNRIALAGHSEGGIIAPIVASTDPRIAAIVLMAGTAKPGNEVLGDQMRDTLERDPAVTQEELKKKLAEQQDSLRAIIEGRDDLKVPQQMRAPWMKEFLKYNPITTIVKVQQPILILQGALDRQVTADQAGLLEDAARKAGNKDVTVHVYPGLNHLFLPAKTGAFSEYTTLSTSSVPDAVLNAMAEWLQLKLKVKK